MAALFISDLHLDASRPAVTAQFHGFLEREASVASALYILGDFFETWIGDDAGEREHAATLAALRRLTAAGVPCHVMHGNRDFLLGERFSVLTGAELLADPVLVSLYGRTALVMHGDALCTDDLAYQRLRATVRDPSWQRRFLSLSAAERQTLASAARDGSRVHTAAMEPTITDVNAASVEAALRAAGTDLLLHGNTHRPAIHDLRVDGRACRRIVLGDWYHQGSVLRWDESGYALAAMPRAGGPE